MRKYLLTLLMAAVAWMVNAQIVSSNEPGLVYYMPQTQIVITVEYDVEERIAGPLAEYADMLGECDAVRETETRYHYIQLNTGRRTMADTERYYKILPQKGFEAQLLSVDPKGILYGYNVTYCPEKDNTAPPVGNERKRTEDIEVMPLNEEALNADGRERAEAVLAQILHLRETRTYLLTGESELQPTDGKQLELLLKELHKQESALTALFVGKRTFHRERKTLFYTPSGSTEVVVGRMNKNKGVVAPEEEGTPIRLLVIAHHQELQRNPSEDNKKIKLSQVYYNLPGSCDYTLYYGEQEIKTNHIDVAQFGVSVPMAQELFVPSNHILFNTRTGNIQSISK